MNIQPRQANRLITSRSNATFKDLLKLTDSSGIKTSGYFLAGGPKVTREIIAENKNHVAAWIRAPGMPAKPSSLEHATEINISKPLFNEINTAGTTGPLLKVRTPNMKPFNPGETWPQGVTLFIPFGDPENVGAVVRSAAGLGAARVVLLAEAACPFLPRTVRASAGAVFRIGLEQGPCLAGLAAQDFPVPIMALDAHGRSMESVEWPDTFGLVAGTEGRGLQSAFRPNWEKVAIPLTNAIESLNAAAAVAVALWDWKSRTSVRKRHERLST